MISPFLVTVCGRGKPLFRYAERLFGHPTQIFCRPRIPEDRELCRRMLTAIRLAADGLHGYLDGGGRDDLLANVCDLYRDTKGRLVLASSQSNGRIRYGTTSLFRYLDRDELAALTSIIDVSLLKVSREQPYFSGRSQL